MLTSKTMSRRQLLRNAVTLGAGVVLAGAAAQGCAPAPAPTQAPALPAKEVATSEAPPKAVAETVTVTWHTFTGAFVDWAQARYDAGFRDEHPNIELKFEPVPSDEYRVKILSMYNSKQLGDAYFCYAVGGGWMAEWAHLGLARPLDDLVQSDNTDLSVFFPSAVASCTWQGKLWGLPILDHGSQGMYFYNKDMLDEAGLGAPTLDGTNWPMDTLVENAIKLKKEEGGQTTVWGWLSMSHWWALNGWLRMFSTDYFNEDGTASIFDSDKVKACCQYIVDFKLKHKVEPMAGQLEGNWRQAFTAGKLALVQGAPAQGAALRAEVDNRFVMGNAWLPPGPDGGRAAVDNSNLMCVSSASKHPAETFEFLKWITTEESAVQMALMKAGTPGARPDAFEDPRVTVDHPEYELIKVMIQASQPEVVPHNLRGTEILNAVQGLSADIFLGNVSVDEGATKVHEAMQEILAKDPV